MSGTIQAFKYDAARTACILSFAHHVTKYVVLFLYLQRIIFLSGYSVSTVCVHAAMSNPFF